MSARRYLVPVLASVWAHLSLVALLGLEVPDLFPDPVEDGASQEGALTEIDGQDALGEALEELVPVGLEVWEAVVQAATPAPPAPVPPPTPPPAEPPPVVPPTATPANEGPAAPVAGQAPRRPVVARPPRPRGSVQQKRKPGPPCEVPPSIESVGDYAWSVEREIVEYYAMNLDELMKQASVWTHKDAGGKPDGFRLGLSRCSVGKAVGLRNGDVVHRINDRKITNIPQAIAAYFDLRNEPELSVHITRGGKPLVLRYELEQPTRAELREIRKATRKEVRRQAQPKG